MIYLLIIGCLILFLMGFIVGNIYAKENYYTYEDKEDNYFKKVKK